MRSLPALLLVSFALIGTKLSAGPSEPPYGLTDRPSAKAYLNMPETSTGKLPRLLSETGAFADIQKLLPVDSLIPYDLIVPFWSDGAIKQRWMSVPNEARLNPARIRFTATGEWKFPPGTVFVKHFELPIDETRPEIKRRLETRLLICDATGSVYGAAYKWRPDNSDAELIQGSMLESIMIATGTGSRTQNWYYPSSVDCSSCHNDNAGGVLGVKTRQLNCEYTYLRSGIHDNQLRTWNKLGLFEPALNETDISQYPMLARSGGNGSLVDRARSYLDANCSQCHRPGGAPGTFDARFDAELQHQNLIDGRVLIDQGIDRARVIASNDTWRSILFRRVNTLEGVKMPPLAHEVIDEAGVALLREWIKSMPGPETLEPPSIEPMEGEFKKLPRVVLRHPDPDAVIRYTLDGSAPGKDSDVYRTPIELDGPATIRARGFRTGFTRSIAVQRTFVQ